VTFDGTLAWFAVGDRLQSFEPEGGSLGASIKVKAMSGTAYDGEFFYQLAEGFIQKLDPKTRTVIKRTASPAGTQSAGMTWAEGALWIAKFPERKILKVDPDSGEVLRTLTAPRCVTGITFVQDQLWHGTWEDDESDIRRISPETGELLESLQMPPGTMVSGREYDGQGTFYAGGGKSGKLRAVRLPK
jgi:streptogramin lyase